MATGRRIACCIIRHGLMVEGFNVILLIGNMIGKQCVRFYSNCLQHNDCASSLFSVRIQYSQWSYCGILSQFIVRWKLQILGDGTRAADIWPNLSLCDHLQWKVTQTAHILLLIECPYQHLSKPPVMISNLELVSPIRNKIGLSCP